MSYFGVSFDSLIQNAEALTEQLVTAAEQATAAATLTASPDFPVAGNAGHEKPPAEPDLASSEDLTTLVERLKSALSKSRDKCSRLKHDRDEALLFLGDVGIFSSSLQPSVGSLFATTLLNRWKDIIAVSELSLYGSVKHLSLEQLCRDAANAAAAADSLRRQNEALETTCRRLQAATALGAPQTEQQGLEIGADVGSRAGECTVELSHTRHPGYRTGDALLRNEARIVESSADSRGADYQTDRDDAADLASAKQLVQPEGICREREEKLIADLATAAAEVSSLRVCLDTLKLQAARADADNAALCATLSAAEDTSSRLEAELRLARDASAETGVALLQSQAATNTRIAELEAALVTARESHAQAEELVVSLRSELEASQRELSELRVNWNLASTELEGLRNELASARAETARLLVSVDKEKAARTRAVEKANRILREQADSHAAELSSLRAELDEDAARRRDLEVCASESACQLSALTMDRDALARQVYTDSSMS